MKLRPVVWFLSQLVALLWASNVHAQQIRTLVTDICPTKPAVAGEKPEVPLLAAILLPEILSLGVDLAGTALSEAAKTKVVTKYSESSDFNYYSVASNGEIATSPSIGCVVIVAGGDANLDKNNGIPGWLSQATGKKQLEWLISTPDFYFEIDVKKRQNNAGLSLTPRILYVSKPFEESGFWHRSERGYVVSMSVKDSNNLTAFGAAAFAFQDVASSTAYTVDGQSVGGQPTQKLANWPQAAAIPKFPENDLVKEVIAGQKSAAGPFREVNAILKAEKLPRVVTRANIADELLKDNTKLSAVCDSIKTWNDANPKSALKDDRCPITAFKARRDLAILEESLNKQISLNWANAYLTSECVKKGRAEEFAKDGISFQICKLPNPDPAMTGLAQIAITIAETTEPSKLLELIATAFNNKKAEIKTAINDRVNPVRRAELEEQSSTSNRNLKQTYQLALLKVQQLEAQLSEATDKPSSAQLSIQIQLAQAKIDSNKAARAAGESVPYPEFD